MEKNSEIIEKEFYSKVENLILENGEYEEESREEYSPLEEITIEHLEDSLEIPFSALKKQNVSGISINNPIGPNTRIDFLGRSFFGNRDLERMVFTSHYEGLDWILESVEPLSLYLDFRSIDSLYIDGWECTIGEMKESVRKLYHYTNIRGLKGIIKDKKLIGTFGSSLTNQNEFGIFTSISEETYSDGVYGDICLVINVENLRKELGEISLSPEPDFLDSAAKKFLLFTYGEGLKETDSAVESIEEPFDGQHHETVILETGQIPIKFITVLDNGEEIDLKKFMSLQ